MNLTLQILVEPATHPLGNPTKAARRYTVGDVVCVWDADVVAPYNGVEHLMRDVISTTKFVFVHVRDVPITLERARDRLCADDSVFGTFDGSVTMLNYYRRKKFSLDASLVPVPIRNRLQSERQITVNFTQIKSYIKQVRDNRLLADSDL